ncbi:MAG TPA: hypothetical protein PKA61_07630 [Nitrospira sp.]|nr:hypothetical protein [Nitrospira sp.]
MAWAFVQKSELSDAGTATSVVAPSITYSSGSLLVILVSSNGGAGTTTYTPTDSQGSPNTYAQIQTTMYDLTHNQGFAMFFAKNIGGGAYTVTVNFNSSVTDRRIVVLEYSGVDTTAPLETSAKTAEPATSGASDIATGAGVTTSTANDLIIVGSMDTSTAPTNLGALGSYTKRTALANSDGIIAVDRNLASAGSETPTFTLDTGADFLSITAAFLQSSGGGGGPSPGGGELGGWIRKVPLRPRAYAPGLAR